MRPKGLSPDGELAALELGTILYLVERHDGARATVVPVAELSPDGYQPLPDVVATPNLLERFPIGRWDAGADSSEMSVPWPPPIPAIRRDLHPKALDGEGRPGLATDRWLGILGPRAGAREMMYHDPCGLPIAPESIRTFP